MTTRYVVIGSNCFTGSHFVDALLERQAGPVVGVSRSPEYKDLYLPYKRHEDADFRFRQIDMVKNFGALAGLLDEVKPQVVIHVAALSEVARSNEHPVEYFETNTTAVAKLCNHLRQQSYLGQYVHISSAEILGPCAQPATEEEPFRPSTPYAVSKAAGDLYIEILRKNFDFPATIIRSTNVFGRHQQLFKIIPRTAIWLRLGRTLELHGGGRAMKSFVHVRDVVAGALAAVEKRKLGAYHFSVGSDATVADVVRMTCEAAGGSFDQATRVVGERMGQDLRYWLDCSKSERELGWRPTVSLEAGIRETVEWIHSNWSVIEKEPLEYLHRC